MGRPKAGGGRSRGLEARLILNMMISRIRRRSGLPLPPSYSPPTVRATHSPSSPLCPLSFSLSLALFLSARHAARRRAHPKHTRAHTRAPTCVHARVPHVLLTSRRGHGTCAVPRRGLMYRAVFPLSLVFTRHRSPSPSSISPSKGERERDVTCFFTLFVIFFLSLSFALCGALNRLLVRTGVYTRRPYHHRECPGMYVGGDPAG